MSDSITVTCGQCQHFAPHEETDDNGNNGCCVKWAMQVSIMPLILSLSQFYEQQLGGCPINDETPRNCLKFVGKYPFVVGA